MVLVQECATTVVVTNESHKRAKSLIYHKDDTIHKSKKKRMNQLVHSIGKIFPKK